jgi:hypothetical protein
MRRRNFAEPVTFCRSPIITKPVLSRMRNGSSPENLGTRSGSGICRGGSPSSAEAIAWMCSATVPQHPPRMFARPLSAYSRRNFEVVSGRSS